MRQCCVLSRLKERLALVCALHGPTTWGLVRPSLTLTITQTATLVGGWTNGQSPVETSGYFSYRCLFMLSSQSAQSPLTPHSNEAFSSTQLTATFSV